MMQKRKILLCMLFLLLACNTLVTLNINVAIISMVRPQHETNVTGNSNKTKSASCTNTTFFWSQTSEQNAINPVNLNQDDQYDWNDHEKRYVLSSYHWLSWLSILPGSVLGQKFGSKIVLGYSLCISAVLSSVIPYLAPYGATVVAYTRMIQGFFSFMAIPGALNTITGNWSTEEDRGLFVAACLGGSSLALGFGSYIFGYIGRYLHWKYIFHLTSICSIVWTVLWYFLVHDFPEKHPTITVKEQNKILKNRKFAITDDNIPIPWKNICTNVPVILCTLLIAASMSNFFVLITFMPIYLNDMYGLDSNQAGIIVGLPQFISGIGGFLIGWLLDAFIKKRWLSVTGTRKVFSCAGCITASLMLIIIAFTKCNLPLVAASYIISTVSRSVDIFGIEPVVIDLSPRFCGILQGISGTITELMALVIVAGINYLSKLLPNEEFWKVVFLVTAAIGLGTAVLFLIWGSAELQSWNDGSKEIQRKKKDCVTEILKPNEEF